MAVTLIWPHLERMASERESIRGGEEGTFVSPPAEQKPGECLLFFSPSLSLFFLSHLLFDFYPPGKSERMRRGKSNDVMHIEREKGEITHRGYSRCFMKHNLT